MGRQFWIDPRWSQHVESKFSLGKESAPKVGREVRITTIQDGGEMVLESANGPFCWVVSVIVGIYQLVREFLVCDGSTHLFGDFVVQALEDRCDAGLFELGVAGFIALQ